jgi:2,4-dienoyl-CoA reductase-like NADH-dependent reductase (Old Yellow Enzyme family)
VRREAGLPVASSWGIDDPHVAERVVADGQMDLVMVGRASAGESALRLSRGVGTEERAAVVDAASAVCALAGALPALNPTTV